MLDEAVISLWYYEDILVCIEEIFDSTSFHHELEELLKKVNIEVATFLHLDSGIRVKNLSSIKIVKIGVLAKRSVNFKYIMFVVLSINDFHLWVYASLALQFFESNDIIFDVFELIFD